MKAKIIAPVFWASAKGLEKGTLIRLERYQCELSLDLKCLSHSYRVVARKKKEGTTYAGKWVWADKQKILDGNVTFDFLTTEDGFLAFGKWKEQNDYQWWFKLPRTGMTSYLDNDDTNICIGDGMDSYGWSTEAKRHLETEAQ